ncbi:hypothetical protein [uncultured Methanobrevibacter sp.]|uniref:hypothetical protein n=1 Tax=uncultured Methanobrevibacter sp. TaxID=253161 RepID=UPI0025E06644|nr:hypothetical protein [uncultured Methanobrevibacter sp.]
MTEKRLIVDNDYNWVDTVTDTVIEVEDAFDLVNDLADKNEELKKENKKLNCIIKQLEAKYEDKGFSLAYDMGECE